MSITNGYATVANVQDASESLKANGTAITPTLERTIESASRGIDKYTNRVFYLSGTADVRYYAPTSGDIVPTDDIVSIVSVASDDDYTDAYATNWTTGMYRTMPRNRLRNGRPWPTTALAARPGYCFPRFRDDYESVKVTGQFGFAATVPTEVVQATIQLSLRYWKRFETPTGVQGGEYGPIYISRKTDPDIASMLDDLRKNVVGVA